MRDSETAVLAGEADHARRFRWARRTRTLCFGFGLAFAMVEMFFVHDAMDLFGGSAFLVSGIGLLAACTIRVWMAFEILVRLGRLIAGRGSSRAFFLTLLIGLFAWSPFVVLTLLPHLPHHSFLWRHEDDFLRMIRSREQGPGVTHYDHGSSFEFSWHTITDCGYVVIYEPDRPAGEQPLSRDTDAFRPRMLDLDIHLRGSWYAVIY